MKKFLFLSSALIMTVYSAFADDTATTDKKITGGAGTCTVDVLGVSDNNATANTIATWDLIDYECPAGQYLLNSDGVLECTECPVGSYCPGGTYTVESDTNGKNTCPADYTSDVAATAESECYMGCELACTQQTCPEHSNNCTHGVSSTTGKQYVNGTCNAEKTFCSIDFECAPGYNKIIVDPEFVFSIDYELMACNLNNTPSENYVNSDMVSDILDINACDILKPGEIITASGDGVLGDTFVKYQVFASNIDKNTSGITTISKSNDNVYPISYFYDDDFSTEITGTNLWVKPVSIFLPTPVAKMIQNITTPYSETDPMWRQLRASVSETEFELFKSVIDKSFTLDESMLKTITPEELWNYITIQTVEIPLNIPYMDLGTDDELMSDTFRSWESSMEKRLQNTSTLYKYFPDINATYCMNNAININWNPDNGTDATQSMCMYNDGLAVPADPVKPGYTFTGWKLVEENTTE